MKEEKRKLLPVVLRDTAPVIAGYVILGMGFGILMKANGYGILLSVIMSFCIYAGSMQYAAVGLLTGNASLLTVALTTVAVNARHVFYGISMIDKYKNAGIRKPYLIFALTDETYSIVCKTERDNDYCLLVSAFDQCYWIAGTLLGGLIGSALNYDFKGIDFSLTALFVTVFTDQWLRTKNHFASILGVLCSVASLLIFGTDNFLIPSMVAMLVVLLIPRKGGAKNA